MTELTIHYPRLVNGVTAAAVTLRGTSRRLALEVPGVRVSDVDANWTRCYSDTGGAWASGIAAAEAAVAGELARWAARHAPDLQHTDARVRPTVRPAGEISFLMFRNRPDERPEYDVADKATFSLELREIRRSADAAGYSLIWRATGCRVLERLSGGEPDEADVTEETEETAAADETATADETAAAEETDEDEAADETEEAEAEETEAAGGAEAEEDAAEATEATEATEAGECPDVGGSVRPDGSVRELVSQMQKMRDEMDALAGTLRMLADGPLSKARRGCPADVDADL